jgi:hypothetical protein
MGVTDKTSIQDSEIHLRQKKKSKSFFVFVNIAEKLGGSHAMIQP